MNGSTSQKTSVIYDVPDADESWELTEEDAPEPVWHDAIIELLKLLLRAWVKRTQVSSLITSNLALRWRRDHWKVSVDPDVAMYIPSPPEGEDTESVCTWEPGHGPPRVAIEVVSQSTASMDYVAGPDQYAASGTTELWVFDPKRLGPKVRGGPFALQVWRRDEAGGFRQIYRGDGPFHSPEMDAWLVITNNGMRLRLANDPEGTDLWLTTAESAKLDQELAEQRTQELKDQIGALQAELERLRNHA